MSLRIVSAFCDLHCECQGRTQHNGSLFGVILDFSTAVVRLPIRLSNRPQLKSEHITSQFEGLRGLCERKRPCPGGGDGEGLALFLLDRPRPEDPHGRFHERFGRTTDAPLNVFGQFFRESSRCQGLRVQFKRSDAANKVVGHLGVFVFLTLGFLIRPFVLFDTRRDSRSNLQANQLVNGVDKRGFVLVDDDYQSLAKRPLVCAIEVADQFTDPSVGFAGCRFASRINVGAIGMPEATTIDFCGHVGRAIEQCAGTAAAHRRDG